MVCATIVVPLGHGVVEVLLGNTILNNVLGFQTHYYGLMT